MAICLLVDQRQVSILDFSEQMASVKQKRFEDENLVIISSNEAINMTHWRRHLLENWDKVDFLFLRLPFVTPTLWQCTTRPKI